MLHIVFILFIPVIIFVLLFMFGVKINRAGTELNNSSLRQAGNIFTYYFPSNINNFSYNFLQWNFS